MSKLPPYLEMFLTNALNVISDPSFRGRLEPVVRCLYQAAYDQHLHRRTAADNRGEHEPVVLGHWFESAQESGREGPFRRGRPFTFWEWIVGIAVCLWHDTCFIPRITKIHIDLEPDPIKKAKMQAQSERNRLEHMRGCSDNARKSLPQIMDPARPGRPLLSRSHVLRIVGLISLHDCHKLGLAWPLSSDWLATTLNEADSLWPISQTGPYADLERDNGADYKPTEEEVHSMAQKNLDTQLKEYRKNFECTTESFIDGETFIRSRAGAEILRRYKDHWGII